MIRSRNGLHPQLVLPFSRFESISITKDVSIQDSRFGTGKLNEIMRLLWYTDVGLDYSVVPFGFIMDLC